MRLFRHVLLAVCLAVLVAPTASAVDRPLPDNFRLEPVQDGLTLPTAMDFTSQGWILISEKGGDVRLIRKGLLDADPVCSVSVTTSGQAGLLGLAAHPDFHDNGWLYLYYTDASGSPKNKVTRVTVAGGSCSGEIDIVSDLGLGGAFRQNGGGMGFGPDGKLYIGTGDVQDPGNGQDDQVLKGKILRLNDDGSIPADNPTAGSAIYALGVRDSRGIAFSLGGTVYASDQGDFTTAHDELNAVQAGGNLGWDDESGSGGVHDDPLVSWNPTTFVNGIGVNDGANFPGDAALADGIDSDQDKYGDDLHAGVSRVDDDGDGVCVGSGANGNPCTSIAQCTPSQGEPNIYCELRDEADEWCPGGTPYGDDSCLGSTGTQGVDEPDESFADDLFGVTSNSIERAILTGAGLDQLLQSEKFLDSTVLTNCPTGWVDVATGPDGFLYALAQTPTGKLYRIIYDDVAGPREVSPAESPFQLLVGKTGNVDEVLLYFEDLRWDSTQSQDNGLGLLLPPKREFSIWNGEIPLYYSHDEADAFITEGTLVSDAVRSEVVDTALMADSPYFLVSGRSANFEGTTGSDSQSVERPGYTITDLCDVIGYHDSPSWDLFKCGRDFTITTAHENQKSFHAEFRGKPTLLDFSAIWCAPCNAQANVMQAFYNIWRPRGADFLTVLSDEDSQGLNFNDRPIPAECRNWEDRPGGALDHTFGCWVDPNPPASKQAWPVYNSQNAYPTNIVLDMGMRVIYADGGYAEGTIETKFNIMLGTTDECVD